MEQEHRISFILRMIHNQTKHIIHKSAPKLEKAPSSQLQGGILGYLYHHRDVPVYQKDLEKQFRVSRATATNTLQVMERNGFIVRKSVDKDARLKRIEMTEEAIRNHRLIEAHMRGMDEKMLQGMSEPETQELFRLLAIVESNLEEMAKEIDGAEEKSCTGCDDV